jgi:hypothetical protein
VIKVGLLMTFLTTAHTAVFAEPSRRVWTTKSSCRSSPWRIRGGSSSVPPDVNQRHRVPQNLAGPYLQSNAPGDSSLYHHPSSSGSNTDSSYAQQQYAPSDDSNHTPPSGERIVDPIHETVQDRLDAWKEKQLENMEHYQRIPIDDKGRTKLVLSVTKSSRIFVFFVFTWRTLHLYEQVVGTDRTSGTSSGILSANPLRPKAVLALPVFLLFLADVLGTILSLTSISSFTKKRLKAILNLNKFAEILVLFYSIVRLTIWPSQYTTREIYVGRVLHSFLLLLQVQAFTRLSWDETAAPSVNTYREMSMAGSTHQRVPVHEESQQTP